MKLEIGYYRVGQKIFDNKIDAVLESQRDGVSFEWDFYKDSYSKVDWIDEPDESLDDLYLKRAKQIRGSYDYVIALVSGGADSSNAVRTFIDNGIFIDEVIALIPESGIKNWRFNDKDLSETNTISEVEYALIPFLKEIHYKSPKTKITINDYFEDIVNSKDNSWVYENCGNIATPLSCNFTNILKFDHVRKLIESGKRVALVSGVDKPTVRITYSGEVYVSFSDLAANTMFLKKSHQVENLHRELFYWTPLIPEIVVKQLHTIVKAAVKSTDKTLLNSMMVEEKKFNPLLYSYQKRVEIDIRKNRKVTSIEDILDNLIKKATFTERDKELSQSSIYQRLISPIIYPTKYKEVFQAQKCDFENGFFLKDQIWIHELHRNTNISDSIISGLKFIHNQIKPENLNAKGSGMTMCVNTYPAGTILDYI